MRKAIPGPWRPEPWLATVYLASYLPVGAALFAFVLAICLLATVLSIVWIGLPLLVAAAVVVRGCAELERGRARLMVGPVASQYRTPNSYRIFEQIRTRWGDSATWRDLAYFVAMFPILLVMDIVGLAIWLAVIGWITVPAWYWSIPYTGDGVSEYGIPVTGPQLGNITVNSPASAALAAGIALLLSIPAGYIITGTARLHGHVAASLLGPNPDPLAEAKTVLANPGPLSTEHS